MCAQSGYKRAGVKTDKAAAPVRLKTRIDAPAPGDAPTSGAYCIGCDMPPAPCAARRAATIAPARWAFSG